MHPFGFGVSSTLSQVASGICSHRNDLFERDVCAIAGMPLFGLLPEEPFQGNSLFRLQIVDGGCGIRMGWVVQIEMSSVEVEGPKGCAVPADGSKRVK